uniref:Uncharacterized protein n=1 Tax=Rhizophora mucronata TaxID=61149 RepID=A0A2P2NAG5_RHIMU
MLWFYVLNLVCLFQIWSDVMLTSFTLTVISCNCCSLLNCVS